jgi:hypothetical protein
MSDIRKFMKLVEELEAPVDEAYTANNSYLRSYLRDADFDPYSNWAYICMWLEENDYLETVSSVLGEEIDDASTLEEYEPDVFYKLPAVIQKECAEATVEYVMQHDPADAPTWAHMSLKNNKLLPRNTWLVHFTNHPYDIASQGFTIGMDEMDKLGLTTYYSNKAKQGGYNFAFIANSRDAKFAASKGKYGKYAVVFQNSGVHAYHSSDEEDQVIFWGKDVSPKSIIVLTKEYDEWQVRSKYRLRNGETVLYTGDFQNCVNWIITNYNQYRRWLT